MLLIRNLVNYSLVGKRSLFATLIPVFNRVSQTRIEAVGPDRACAEWLMKNGAFIRWKGQPKFVEHYDNLPLDEKDKTPYFIEEVDATKAPISHHGFPYFKSCNHIKKVKLINCRHVNDKCLDKLSLLAKSLCILEVIECSEVTDDGLMYLRSLRKLEQLKIGQFMNVKDFQKCVADLELQLPECDISTV